ncbi:Glutathione S-transferase 8 [Physocladia obscura]|uniref:Glutathione S-transferase 8 n=1 Tax=Physocladia obscura TaxID=109957 RepID=A0AAD5XER5_9FUNG|nr:Glutathione S-transferase 8 [Physocladia obscura]
MAAHQLYVFNQNYSSWSLRPLIVVLKFDLPVNVSAFNLADPVSKAEAKKLSTTGFLPALTVASRYTVSDSLAILETLAELFPEKKIWPTAFEQRAKARAIAAEMHSGFSNIRNFLTCNLRVRYPAQSWSADVSSEIKRVLTIWENARTEAVSSENDDGWLFGQFSAADAMYFPVVSRFLTYCVAIDADEFPLAKAYFNRVFTDDTVKKMYRTGEEEDWVIEKYENVYPGMTFGKLVA